MQRLDDARKLLRTVSVQSADERTQLILAEAQLLRDAKRYDESYKLLSQALASAPDRCHCCTTPRWRPSGSIKSQ